MEAADRGKGHLPNASITLVKVDAGGKTGELLRYGDASHLLGPSSTKNVDALGHEDEAEAQAIFYKSD